MSKESADLKEGKEAAWMGVRRRMAVTADAGVAGAGGAWVKYEQVGMRLRDGCCGLMLVCFRGWYWVARHHLQDSYGKLMCFRLLSADLYCQYQKRIPCLTCSNQPRHLGSHLADQLLAHDPGSSFEWSDGVLGHSLALSSAILYSWHHLPKLFLHSILVLFAIQA